MLACVRVELWTTDLAFAQAFQHSRDTHASLRHVNHVMGLAESIGWPWRARKTARQAIPSSTSYRARRPEAKSARVAVVISFPSFATISNRLPSTASQRKR